MTSRQTINLVPAAIKKAMFRGRKPSPDEIHAFLGRFGAQCARARVDASGMANIAVPASWARFLEWALLRYVSSGSLDAAFLLTGPGAPPKRKRDIEIATEMLRFRRSPEARKRGSITRFQERLAEAHELADSGKVRKAARKFKSEADERLAAETAFARLNATYSAAGRQQ